MGLLPDSGPHAAFIWAAYAAALLVFVGLTLNAVLSARAQHRALARMQSLAGEDGA